MSRRSSGVIAAVALAAISISAQEAPVSTAARIEQLYRQAELVSRAAAARYNIVEATISDMQRAMSSGRISSEELVALHLVRIAQYDGKINAIIAVNPSALDVARALDRERAAGKVRGPLHGVPIALKDIINTSDLPTTGGALAFAGITPPYDATLTASLRAAGAVIIAKTQLTELANWVTVGMPNNYNGFNGYGMNPYDPRTDPRTGNDANGYPFNDGRPVMNTGGSSSGTGTAASFWAANVGTETSGSILSPSNQTMLVGIKPTVGRISRYGIMPITADQDTAGPMARTVSDAALLMGALESNTPDPNDAATRRCVAPPGRDYTRFLRLAGLRGARIGIPRANFYAPVGRPDGATVGGLTAEQTAVMNEAIEVLKAQGAVIVDPADIPSVVDGTADNNFLLWGICASAAQGKGGDAACSVDFKYGMKRDFNLYLNSLGPTRAFKTLTDLRTYNSANVPRGAIKYGQVLLDISDQMDLVADLARYQADRAKDLRLSDTHGIGEAMQRNNLDALLFPGASSANIAARAGFPTVIVPFGTIPNPAGASSVAVNAANPALPAGFNPLPQPYGVGFTSTACNEPRLIELAYAFEQATKRRVPPPNMP